jgi:hypothetical protein
MEIAAAVTIVSVMWLHLTPLTERIFIICRLAFFVGVNHHFQGVIFGVVMLEDQERPGGRWMTAPQ